MSATVIVKSSKSTFRAVSREAWPALAAMTWARSNLAGGITDLDKSLAFQGALARAMSVATVEELVAVAEQTEPFTLKNVESFLELSQDAEDRRASGVVYTPDYVIDFIIGQTLGERATRNSLLLDPACGSGGFLVRAVLHLSRTLKISFTEASSMVRGIDVSPVAVRNAELLLDLCCLGADGIGHQARIECMDALTTPVGRQLRELGCPAGVDALVTNPPFVKLQNLEVGYRQELAQSFSHVAGGAFTLATLFLENSISYLRAGGEAGFITMNNVFTSLAGQQLRESWTERRSVRRVVDFRHFSIFESASAYTCLIFLDTKTHSTIAFNAVAEQPTAETLRKLNPSGVKYSTLSAKKWRLAEQQHQRVLERLESGTRLREVAQIKVGFATLLDKAFTCRVVNGNPTALGADGIEREVELESTARYIKVSSVMRGLPTSDYQSPIIYPYNTDSDDRLLIAMDEFAERFPKAFGHLATWRDRLSARKGVSADWHQWGRRQSLTAPGPKLLTKTFDSRPAFALDSSSSLFCNGYSIRPLTEDLSILHLKEFLESRFMLAHALLTSFEISGGYQCYQKNFIASISVPPADLLSEYSGRMGPTEEGEVALCAHFGFELRELESCIRHYSPDLFAAMASR